jgi:hypothetical protein
VKDEFGAFVGQKGLYIKFLDSAFRKLMGVGVVASEEVVAEERPKKREKAKKK